METKLSSLGISPEDRSEVFNLIDRRDKMDLESWKAYAADLGLSLEQVEGVLNLIQDQDLWQESEELVRFFNALDFYGVKDYIRFAPHIIRGLVYYTGTVFEAWDTQGDYRAIFGGGRYDNLVGDVGGEPVGGVGFAVGDLIIGLLLEELGRLPKFGDTPSPVFFTLFDETLFEPSMTLASQLREAGLRVTSQLQADKLGKHRRQSHRRTRTG
jgi:histidyl-tRNA synthetase